MSMNKIFSLVAVSGVLALSAIPANAESIPQIVHDQISDRSVQSFAGATSGKDASVSQQEVWQFGNSARPDVDASASRGSNPSLVDLEYQQIPH